MLFKDKKYMIGGLILYAALIYFFAPPLVDFIGRGSKYKQWKNRNNKNSINTTAIVTK